MDPSVWLVLHCRVPGIGLVLTEREIRQVRSVRSAFDVVRTYECVASVLVAYDILKISIEARTSRSLTVVGKLVVIAPWATVGKLPLGSCRDAACRLRLQYHAVVWKSGE